MRSGHAGTLAERRYADVRLAVAIAARDLFIENHSTAVTVEAIAQRAGVSERTFYRHFPSKADLVTPLFERSARWLVDALHQTEPPPAGVVHALVDVLTEQMTSDSEDWRELLELLVQTPEYRLRWECVDVYLVDALADWLAANSVHDDDIFTRRVTALLILTASRASYSEWLLRRDNAGTDELRTLHFTALRAIDLGWQPR
ncbi:TetR family transcriptional regulator [Rhodococcus sp. OK519]|uniref:TetR/AcrR family transcriptional regulator n=1 Tax=Rhodococcus sp. OK519 TaxID=2135729 RepID=UPI000D3487BA|nr:TetR family transcriptional regulator [Rhodococcus sp. OK519]